MKTSAELRTAFLDYFQAREHKVVPSSTLVPHDDPSLLFTNAGMVQFKDVFLGLDKRPYKRAVTAQRCVRAGGKHNDLENVGYTARHHTFFEMLGNFSFGDYFKHEAITYAWDFLLQVLEIPASRLWITVYENDDEAANIWLQEIGITEERLSRCGDKDNFWSMGETGPCGPCTEIFYDHGEALAGHPPGSGNQQGERYVEIWNLVFTQYNRDAEGKLVPIPAPSVDTGMGLERVAAVMQGVHNNYDIDLFRSLIAATSALLGGETDKTASLQVIADHIRACAFLISDGVMPSNEGRSYVLRRIIRRAARHGNKLGFREPFLHKLINPLSELMGDAYPELKERRENVEQVLRQEEQRFTETLTHGLQHLEAMITGLAGNIVPGIDVFKLYDTYGFPVDLTADIARERGLDVDLKGFEQAMRQQKERARRTAKFALADKPTLSARHTEFSGYELLEQQATVAALYQDGKSVGEMQQGESGDIVLNTTPFYAEAGGQVGDRGQLIDQTSAFAVTDTQKRGQTYIHSGTVTLGHIQVGQVLNCQVDQARRLAVMRNHSATHLLHAALRKILGKHVIQKGSLVDADRLRFDFSHPAPMQKQQLQAVELLVNEQILANQDSMVRMMPQAQAKASGALSLFGEKYDETVRVLNIGGDFSMELCGGTHVARAGDIGLMKIISETGVAAGVRRLEAVTGEAALAWINTNEQKLDQLAQMLKTERNSAIEKLDQTLEQMRTLEKTLDKLQVEQASHIGQTMAAETNDINGIQVIAKAVPGADINTLRMVIDQLKTKLSKVVVVLASVTGSKVNLVAGVSKEATSKIQAGDLVNMVAQQIGGKGGGRPDLAQGGGNEPSKLESALASVSGWVRERV